MVSTDPPRKFQIEIFRMGYYGGRGARLVQKIGPLEGKAQTVPTPGPKNLHEWRWEPSVRLTIPRDWMSGVHLGRLTTLVESDLEPYWQRYVIFIVRDDRPADILFQSGSAAFARSSGPPRSTLARMAISYSTHPQSAGPRHCHHPPATRSPGRTGRARMGRMSACK
jgi:hypothetical protein